MSDAVRDDFDDYLDEALKDPLFRIGYEDVSARQDIILHLISIRRRGVLTQRDVAERMGVSQPTVCEIETGANGEPRLSTIQRYARAIGMRLVLAIAMDPGCTCIVLQTDLDACPTHGHRDSKAVAS